MLLRLPSLFEIESCYMYLFPVPTDERLMGIILLDFLIKVVAALQCSKLSLVLTLRQ